VRIVQDLTESIHNREVLIIEDIVDTGMTLQHLIKQLRVREPASLRVCALLDKLARRLVETKLDYVGFEIPDEFVVGYGLDYQQRFRNLPFIATVRSEALREAAADLPRSRTMKA
jgi:hypoxanthine phosphoribosyltransferase